MSIEKNIEKMTYVRVSCGNVERIKSLAKQGETFDDVLTTLLDFYQDLRRQDLTSTQSNWKQKERKSANECRTL